MLMPVSTRTIDSITAQATPMDSAMFIMLCDTVPPVTSSTCLLSTCTAGSALTM